MKGANTLTANMDSLQIRLRESRKACADDGFNNQFCQVFNDAIDEIERLKTELLMAKLESKSMFKRVVDLEADVVNLKHELKQTWENGVEP